MFFVYVSYIDKLITSHSLLVMIAPRKAGLGKTHKYPAQVAEPPQSDGNIEEHEKVRDDDGEDVRPRLPVNLILDWSLSGEFHLQCPVRVQLPLLHERNEPATMTPSAAGTSPNRCQFKSTKVASGPTSILPAGILCRCNSEAANCATKHQTSITTHSFSHARAMSNFSLLL